MLIFSCVRIGWELVAEKTECDGKEKDLSPQPTTEACAKACEGISSLFIFGTNDFQVEDKIKGTRCDSDGCKCWCETAAGEDGTCTQEPHPGFRLYKFVGKYFF